MSHSNREGLSSTRRHFGFIALSVAVALILIWFFGGADSTSSPLPEFDATRLVVTKLSPDHPDRSQPTPTDPAHRLTPRFQPISAFAGDASTDKREAQARVLGRVEDFEGNPISGARLTVYLGRDPDTLRMRDPVTRTRSDLTGRFDLRLPSPFEGWLTVESAHHSPVEDFIRLAVSEEAKKTYVLRETAGLLHGRVREAGSRKPLEGVMVFCNFIGQTRGDGGSAMHLTFTDPMGRYELRRLPQGERFFVSFGSTDHLLEVRWVTLTDGNDRKLDILLTPGRKVMVRVADRLGRPIFDAQIKDRTLGNIRTDRQGQAEILIDPRESASGQEHLIVAEGYLSRMVNIDASEGTQEFRLDPAPSLRVRVLTERGTPIAGAHVLIWAAPRDLSARGPTDGEGWATLNPSKEDVHSIWVSHDDYLGLELELEGDSLGKRPVVEIVLEEGTGGLAGRISMSDGQPATSVWLILRRHGRPGEGDGVLRRHSSNIDGRFVVLGLPPGTYDLVVLESAGVSRRPETISVQGLEVRDDFVLSKLDLALLPRESLNHP